MRLALATAFLLLAGCSSPTYEKPDPPATPVPDEASDRSANGTGDERPDVLVDSENEHVRFTLDDHRVAGTAVTLYVTFTNKDPVGEKITKYALLGTDGASTYFDFAATIAAGATRSFELTANEGDGRARAPWTNLSLYYTDDTGGEFSDDAAIEVDLAGRGLPSKVS